MQKPRLFLLWLIARLSRALLGPGFGAVAIYRHSRMQRSTPCRSYHKHRAEWDSCKGRFLPTVSCLVRYAESSREKQPKLLPDASRARGILRLLMLLGSRIALADD